MATTTRTLYDTFSGGLGLGSMTITNGGTGYTSTPTVVVPAPPAGGGQASATATVVGGIVTAITVTNPGNSYVVAPTITFTGGGGSAAAATAVMTTGIPGEYSGETCVLLTFTAHGAATTIDASTYLGGSNGTQGFQKYRISSIEWSTDQAIAVTFTGTGLTEAITVAPGQGSFKTPLVNTTTQPGTAANADVVVTPAAGTDGFMLLKLVKEDFA
jgi:hypothetical protein